MKPVAHLVNNNNNNNDLKKCYTLILYPHRCFASLAFLYNKLLIRPNKKEFWKGNHVNWINILIWVDTKFWTRNINISKMDHLQHRLKNWMKPFHWGFICQKGIGTMPFVPLLSIGWKYMGLFISSFSMCMYIHIHTYHRIDIREQNVETMMVYKNENQWI